MESTRVTKTVSEGRVGNKVIQQQDVVTDTQADPQEFTILKMAQFLWYVAHVINIFLALRFVFLLLGARLTGIVLFIYNVSNVFIAPFRGVFPAAREGASYFDSAAVLGIVMYYLATFVIIQGIALFSKQTNPDV